MNNYGSFVLKSLENGSLRGSVVAGAGADEDVGWPAGQNAGLGDELPDEPGGADDEDSAVLGRRDTIC